MDDVVTGADDHDGANTLKSGIEEILNKGGFKIKGFITSGGKSDDLSLLPYSGMESVLGVWWNPEKDVFRVKVRINLSKKSRQARTSEDLKIEEIPILLETPVTRRLLLGITNSCNDTYGSLAPLTVALKIGLRKINGRGWDEELPLDLKEEWVRALTKLKQAETVTFKRCVKPENAVGKPSLIVCNDGSEVAMCTTAHIRWMCDDDSIQCCLWSAKTRVTPLKKITIPKIELMSAMMGVRLAKKINKSSIWEFEKIFHITDSKCMLATLSKETSTLGEFVGNRVTEVLDTTEIDQWYHIGSNDNISDLGTRGQATASDVAEDSDWQLGPSWMYQPIEEWPVDQDVGRSTTPDEFVVRRVVTAIVTESAINYEKYRGRSYEFVRNLTARLIRIFKDKSMKNSEITSEDLRDADSFILKMSMIKTKESFDKGSLNSLRPQLKEDGTIILGGRASEGMSKFYGSNEYPILTYQDPISHLWIKKTHKEDHSGVMRTVAKSRRKFWIVRAGRLAAKVRRECFRCRLLDKLMAQQQMAPLPKSRQVMSPTFSVVSMDLFGPYEVKDVVKKRTHMKVWGLIINCLVTRALHIEVTEGYGTEHVIQTLRKFIAIRGTPTTIHSDKGSQLISEELKVWAVSNEINLQPTPAEGQHQNGCSESLIKSVKRSLAHVIGKTILTFSGLQMVLYEVATLINSRPIGILTGSDPTQPEPITPNHLILGRATTEPVKGSLDMDTKVNKRLQFLNALVADWWKRWYETVLPTLVPSYKWLQRHRNVRVGDVCLIRYKNEIKGNYRLGKVNSVKKGKDGLVRTVTLLYKNPNERTFREVDRPVHGIAVIVPIEEQAIDVVSELNPTADEFKPSLTLAEPITEICEEDPTTTTTTGATPTTIKVSSSTTVVATPTSITTPTPTVVGATLRDQIFVL